jgi:RNA polymerase sigma factor (sigma-70 family)
MAAGQLSEVVQHLRRSVLVQEGPGLTDGQLLGCFIAQRDDAAFAVLVRRHGPMVWGVCRRLLNQHDAEDAFQATFLVLARKAASIVQRERVANWLYGAAHQTALQARRNIARRRAREKQVMEMPEPAVAEQDLWRDLRPLLDQELSRLPDAYREVIVLSDLEGKTRKEVARQLGLPEGTVGSRLARARTMLAKRLTRQGVTLAGGALGAVLAQQVASAGVPCSVVDSTIKAASLLTAGQVAATGAISLKVATLTEGVLKTMLLTKLKAALGVVMLLGFVATVMTVLVCRTAAEQGDKQPTAEKAVKTSEKQEPVSREEPSGKTEPAKGLKLTLSADKTETVPKPGTFYGADPVQLKLTFTNTSDKPIRLDAYILPYRIKFQCDGPGPDSVKKQVLYVDMVLKPPTEKDYPVLQPGQSWSPSWTPAFPGDIPDGVGAVAAYSLRQPGSYKLRMTVYDKYAPHAEGATEGTKWLESNELELKVRKKE